MRGAERLGRELVDLGGERGLCTGAEQQHGLQRIEAHRGIGRGEGGRDGERGLAVGAIAGGEERDEAADQRLGVGGEHFGGEHRGGDLGAGAEGFGEKRGVEGSGEAGAFLADLEQERVGIVAGELAREVGEVGGVVGGERVEHLGAERAGLAVLQHGELGGDARLEREAAEQRLAEGVDGLDLQPARGLERTGEQGAGAGELGGWDRRGLAEGVEGVLQRGVVEHRPGAEGPEQPVLHLGRGGLGVGEAEDLLRLGAGEQQAGDPVGEHAGLAGAGVGGDPARRRGGRGADLGGGGLVSHHASSVLVAVGPLAEARELVVVAAPGQLLRPQAGGEAVRRVLIVGDQGAEPLPQGGEGVGIGVERQGLALLAELQQLEVQGAAGRQRLEAAGLEDGGLERQLEVEGARLGGAGAGAGLVVVDRVAAGQPVDAVGAGGDGEGVGEAVDRAAALDLAGGRAVPRTRRSASPSRNQRAARARRACQMALTAGQGASPARASATVAVKSASASSGRPLSVAARKASRALWMAMPRVSASGRRPGGSSLRRRSTFWA